MTNHKRMKTSLFVILALIAGCGPGNIEPTATLPATSPLPTTTSTVAEPPAETPAASPAAVSTATPVVSEEITSQQDISVEEAIASLQGLPFDTFLEDSYTQLLLRDPDSLVFEGLADRFDVGTDHFTDISDAYIRQTQQLESAILEQLRTYDREALDLDQQLSYDLYEWYLTIGIEGHAFMYHDFPVNSFELISADYWIIDFMANYVPIENKEDAEAYINRLSSFDTWMAQLLEGLKLREEAGIIPYRYLVLRSQNQMDDHLQLDRNGVADIEEIELYKVFKEKLNLIDLFDQVEKENLLEDARAEIENTVVPAYLELKNYLSDLVALAPSEIGLGQYPNGEAYYAYMLRQETTTDMTADEIHELGLREVARIQEEIRQVAHTALGYPENISMTEVFNNLWSESEYLSADEKVAEFHRLLAEVTLLAADYFDVFPAETDVAIELDPIASTNYYVGPAADGSRPGTFYTPPGGEVRFMLPDVLYHEAIPGHHVTSALSVELDLPTFRKLNYVNAYVEGWGLYAERLAWEMGLYANDPMGDLGRMQLELLRAARLVIDTGLNIKGWTLEEGAAYMSETLGIQDYPTQALVRFITWPGQGCSYYIGYSKILELRQRAMDQLGGKFDIKEFHNVVLSNGAVPLGILENLVEEWIEAEQLQGSVIDMQTLY